MLTSRTNEPGERSSRSLNELSSRAPIEFCQECIIERVSTVTSEFLQYQARVGIWLNRADCQTNWFIYIPSELLSSCNITLLVQHNKKEIVTLEPEEER
jgi:hypothetical protein